MLKKTFYILLFSTAWFCAIAQGNKSAFGDSPGSLLKSLYKEEYSRKKEIKLDGKKYRIYNNYVTVGAGKGYNSGWNEGLFTSAVDFNFHLQKTYFQMGGLLQGRSYGDNQLIQLHFCAGYRKESYNYFWAAYGGLSYTDGFFPLYLKNTTGGDSTVIQSVKQIGLYAAVQAFYKVKFDYGIGFTLFGDVNQQEYMVGLRLELFFSGAFRGNIRHKEEE